MRIEAIIKKQFFYRNCEILDSYVFKVPVNQRQNTKLKVDQLKYDVKHLQVRHILGLGTIYLGHILLLY